jgi:hypothetical protein
MWLLSRVRASSSPSITIITSDAPSAALAVLEPELSTDRTAMCCALFSVTQDVMVCVLVPLVVKAVFSSDLPNQIQQWIKDRLVGKKDHFVRSISCVALCGGCYTLHCIALR